MRTQKSLYVERENRLAVQENRITIPEPVADTPEHPKAEAAPPSPSSDTFAPSFPQRRAELLEELYTAVSSFTVDSAVYEGTIKDDRFRLALLKHRLPRLKELVAELNELSPADTTKNGSLG